MMMSMISGVIAAMSIAAGPETQPSGARTSPASCSVLEAAYTAAAKSKFPVYPLDVRPESWPLEFHKSVPEFRQEMALRPGEFEDLVAQDSATDHPPFQPDCDWSGMHSRYRDEEGHQMFVSFTSPLFSSDRKLAVVRVSFREPGYGFGKTCVVRRVKDAWSAQCLQSWVT